jgi:hypothetical protein
MEMRISGKNSAPVEKIVIPKNKAGGDGQQAIVTLAFRVDQSECLTMFGEEFTEKVAFASMVRREDDDGGVVFAHLSPGKLTKDMVMEIHDVKIFGLTVRSVQPEAESRGVDREPKVDVLVKIPVPIGSSDKADLALVRSGKVGTTVKAEFIPHPKDEALPLEPRKAG